LTNANFTGAVVRGADFGGATANGFTAAQLYSTASYQANDLRDIKLPENDLTGWNFASQDLEEARFEMSTLDNANLADANLTGAQLHSVTLWNANLTGAVVRDARMPSTHSGFTSEQLYSTASYQNRDLREISLAGDLAGWDLSGQNLTGAELWESLVNVNLSGSNLTSAHIDANLTNANLAEANLTGAHFSWGNLTNANLTRANLTGARMSLAIMTGANLTGAIVQGANLSSTTARDFTAAQLYSTASYQSKQLTGIRLSENDLSGWDFSGQNLTAANLSAKLNDANFTGAVIRGANFGYTTHRGFTAEQLYSTASYQAKDLAGIDLGSNDLSGWNFVAQNLTHANFGYLRGSDMNVSFADTRGAGLSINTSANTRNQIEPDGRIGSLNLSAGEKLVAYPGVSIPVHVSGEFAIAPDATFDLTDNDLIVRATRETQDSLHAEVEAEIKRAHNGVDGNGLINWNGPGITTSTARATNIAAGFDLVGLGVIRNSDLDTTMGVPGSTFTSFGGVPVTPDDVLVKYTYTGDGNLDGAVTFDDYAAMDATFFGSIPNLGWATGDINFDGVINFDDYAVVDQAFFHQGAPLSGEEGGVEAVPEPGTWLIAAIALAVALRARRRLHQTVPASRAA
jgi:uncharacterized protein YjbI with pentapeptide repeats